VAGRASGLEKVGGWWRWVLVSPDGVAPSQIVSVPASVNLALHRKVQKFSSGTGSPGWSRKKGSKMVVVWWWSQYLSFMGILLCCYCKLHCFTTCVLNLTCTSCHQQGHAPKNPPVLNWGCWLTQVVLYNGHKTVVQIVVVFID